MIALFGLGRWDISDGLEQAPIVEPVDPFEGGVFNGFKGFPWSSPMDEFGLVETVDGFGQGVVVAVPDTADRRFDAGQAEPLGIADGQVLAAPVRVMDQSGFPGWPALAWTSRRASPTGRHGR